MPKFTRVVCKTCGGHLYLTEDEYAVARATGVIPRHYRHTWRRTTERCGRSERVRT